MNFKRNLKFGSILFCLCILIITAYEGILYSIGHTLYADKAEGSFLYDKKGNIRGSALLVQDFKSEKYFTGRIHTRYDSKCDVALYNEVFRETLNKRYSERPNSYDVSMLTPSSSLRDPYITRREAILQSALIASVRGVDLATLNLLIQKVALMSAWPFFELDIVNVTKLNVELDLISNPI